METLNTLHLLQPTDAEKTCLSYDADHSSTGKKLQVGDIVGFDDNADGFPIAIGMIMVLKPEDKDRGTDECIVVQVGPKVLGIYHVEQLIGLPNAELQAHAVLN